MEHDLKIPRHPILRRQPQQDRSRERVDEILKVAMQLIGEKGIDAVTMKEVAGQSGGPLASVYQYFPNKSAIIATLYERHAQTVCVLLDANLEKVETVEDVYLAAAEILYAYYENVRSTPALQDLLNAVQADKALYNLDIAETRLHAEKFTAATKLFIPQPSWERYNRVAFLMFQLTATAVRLALLLGGEEARNIIEDYKDIIHGQLRLFVEGNYNE